MAVTITSSSSSAEAEIRETLAAHGFTPEGERQPSGSADAPGKDTKPSEPTKEPGVSPGAPAAGESASASEAGKELAQGATPASEEPEQPPVKDGEPAKPPRRDNFKSRVEKQQAKIDRLADDLDLERGSKAKLLQQLEEAKAELAKLKPAEANPADKKDDGPVKPTRPKLADCDFDQDKLDAALDKYDEDVAEYHRKVAAKTVADEIGRRDREAAEAKAADEKAKVYNSFVERKDADRKAYADWDEVFEALTDATDGKDIAFPEAVHLYLLESDHPGHLLHFFAKDAVDGTGELAKIATMSPVRQIVAMQTLESKLASGQKAEPAAAEKPRPVETRPAAEVPPPAKPKPPVREEEPIEPVGSRASAKAPQLSDAKTAKDYLRMRSMGVR